MNAKLIEDIAKILGKHVKWVVIVIATAGAGAIIWYLERRIKSKEKKKNEVQKIAESYERKLKDLQEKLEKEQKEHGERIKEYIDLINAYRKSLDEALAKANQYAKEIEKAKSLKTQLSTIGRQ